MCFSPVYFDILSKNQSEVFIKFDTLKEKALYLDLL